MTAMPFAAPFPLYDSRWNGQSVTRWKPDTTEDRWGTFLFLRDTATNEWWSATSAPRSALNEKSKVIFGDDKAEFFKTVGDIAPTLECIVGTEHDAEGRRLDAAAPFAADDDERHPCDDNGAGQKRCRTSPVGADS